MKKRSKILIISLAACLVVAIGATMAYFFAKTGPVTNVFTLSKGINIKLAEPAWDNKDYDGNPAGVTDVLGNVLCQNFVPGREIPKDPSVKNTSEDNNSVWIAIKLDYTVGTDSDNIPDTYAELAKFADIDWDTTNWDMDSNSDHVIFYYNKVVQTGSGSDSYTSNLFNKVTIKNDVPTGVEYNPFDIKVTAYAVQAEGLDLTAAKTQLAGFIAK